MNRSSLAPCFGVPAFRHFFFFRPMRRRARFTGSFTIDRHC